MTRWIPYVLRCLWHGRLRKHGHCWDCDGVNFNGTLRCDRCRDGERR